MRVVSIFSVSAALLLSFTVAEGTGGAATAAERQLGAVVAIVIADAPIYVKVGFTTPMRVAAPGTRLNVIGPQGDWTQVQFNDPQFGLRTGWIATNLIRVERADLQPMDLSVADDSAPPDTARARTLTSTQPPAERRRGGEGLWFNIGLGAGSLGCQDCSHRDTGLSGGLALGAALTDRVLLAVGTTGFAREFDGELLTVGTLDGRVRFYPSRSSGFFLNAGIGLGSFTFLGDSEFGLGVMLGVGWDIRVGRNVSLTPFWNGSAMSNSDIDANFGQLGLGITIH